MSKYRLMRQDDNGNVYEIIKGLSQADADKLKSEFESHKHKQMYWIEDEAMVKPKLRLNNWDEVTAFMAKHLKPVRKDAKGDPIYSGTEFADLIKKMNVSMPDDV